MIYTTRYAGGYFAERQDDRHTPPEYSGTIFTSRGLEIKRSHSAHAIKVWLTKMTKQGDTKP